MESKDAILVINYKNFNDTIECLSSLIDNCKTSTIFILDNASPNESCEVIQNWLDKNKNRVSEQLTFKEQEFIEFSRIASLPSNSIVFIKTNNNMGFAGGNNFIIKNILNYYDYFLLFNNDAICLNNIAVKMKSFLEENKEYGMATCRINHYSPKEKLQQMGGELLWYGHFKRYDEKFLANCINKGINNVDVTFASGCVMMLKKENLIKHGLLSETIFFGEEDVDLCLRYKKLGIKIVSVLDAVVLHKGGAAQQTVNESKDAPYATSITARAIMLKHRYNKVYWHFWFYFFTFMMSVNIMVRRGYGWKRTAKIMQVTKKYTKKNNHMTRDTYLSIMNEFK